MKRANGFPFLFGGTFIEGHCRGEARQGEGLFPFLFGGTFIEGFFPTQHVLLTTEFPFLFGGTFIEGSPIAGLWGWFLRISLPFRRDFH